MRLSIPVSAFVASIVGFGGTLAIIIAAANAVGASQAQTASGVTAICLAMAIESLWLSWRTKMPVITAWSTPGAALVAASEGFTIGDAVGAFLITAALLIVTGLFGPLTRLIARIPASVASGMLAGIVVGFVTGAVKAIPDDPWLLLPLVAAFFVIRLFNPALSVLAVLVGGGAAAFLTGRVGGLPAPELSTLTLIQPTFSLSAAIGLALPLYLVTMASQNLSGLAVLRAAGYHPEPGPLITVTGLLSLLSAPFGALTTNLAAISAAICTGPDSHPDPAERWKTGPFYALAYLVFAIFGASLVAVFAVLPQGLIVLTAGLALTGALINALAIALKDETERMAAIAAFAVTASGVTLYGVGAAFWGLIAGLAVLGLDLAKKGKQ
jgi:benzoate membrane transport protein